VKSRTLATLALEAACILSLLSCGGSPATTDRCAPPSFDPPGDTYASPQSITIASGTLEASIFYTLDGTDPTTSSTRLPYTAPVSVSSTTTLEAFASKSGFLDSSVNSALYTIQPAAPGTIETPTATPTSGAYLYPQSVTLSCATATATVRYTLDTTVPTETSPAYHTPIDLPVGATVVRARAFAPDLSPSAIASFTYAVTATAAGISFTFSGGGDESIDLSQSQDFAVSLGASITVSVSQSFASYQWVLNGVLEGWRTPPGGAVTGNPLSLSSAELGQMRAAGHISLGINRLTVIVTTAGIPFSKELRFQVTE
jgi:hypothetical protein